MTASTSRKIALAALASFAGLAMSCSDTNGDKTSGGSSPAPASGGDPWFEEVALASGVDFEHENFGTEQRWWFPEIMGGGVAFFDYDQDGDPDLYFVQSGDLHPDFAPKPGNVLYRNEGDGTFTDVTQAAGVGDTGYGMGCTTGDYDADGDVDLYVTNVGPNVLYRNDGDGTFTDVTEAAGVGNDSWGTSCGFVDYDRDGDLDLFLVNYVNWSSDREIDCTSNYGNREYCHPNNFNAPAQDALFRNDGGDRFTDVSEAAGISEAFGNGLGIAFGDFNADGHVDLYVANDGNANQLWIGSDSGKFEDEAMLAGCALSMQGIAEAGMGVASVDIDEDGDLDLFMTHLREESNTFYFNKAGVFRDQTTRTGLSGASLKFTGFGTGFADFDCDGSLDLYVANGRVSDWQPRYVEADPYVEPNQLFRGLGGGRFEELLPRGGTVQQPMYGTSRGLAFADYDADGDLDVAIADNKGPGRLLRNIVSPVGEWVLLDVVTASGTPALGASVTVRAGDQTFHRQVLAAFSYCAASDPRVHLGLGDADKIDEVEIVWPDGEAERFGPFDAGGVYRLARGTGQ